MNYKQLSAYLAEAPRVVALLKEQHKKSNGKETFEETLVVVSFLHHAEKRFWKRTSFVLALACVALMLLR